MLDRFKNATSDTVIHLMSNLLSFPIGLKEVTYSRIETLTAESAKVWENRIQWAVYADPHEEKIRMLGTRYHYTPGADRYEFELHEIVQDHPNSPPKRLQKDGLLPGSSHNIPRFIGIPLKRNVKRNEQGLVDDTTQFLYAYEQQRSENRARYYSNARNIPCLKYPIDQAEANLGYPVTEMRQLEWIAAKSLFQWTNGQQELKGWYDAEIMQACALVLGADAIINYQHDRLIISGTLVKKSRRKHA